MMSPDWCRLKIGQLGRIVTGKTPPSGKPELFGEDHPFITPSDIDGVSRVVATERFISRDGATAFKNQMIPSGSVCFVCIGATIGKMCVATRQSMTNQQINTVVVDTERYDARFVYYMLKQLAPDVKGMAGGAATPIISKSSFSEIEVMVAPREKQGRIASMLSAYDDLIENNTRRIAILEEMARRIYEEWFVRFRFPGHENVRMVESELGLVPEGWASRRLDEIAEIKGGKQLEKEHIFPCGAYPVYGGNGIQGFSESATHHGFVIAFGRVGAYCGSIHWSLKGAWLNNNSSSIVPVAYPDLLLQHLIAFDFSPLRGGAAQPFISNGALAGARFLMPDDATAQRAMGVLSPIRRLQDALVRANRNLRTTRDLLLPKLISGDLDVSDLPEPETAAG